MDECASTEVGKLSGICSEYASQHSSPSQVQTAVDRLLEDLKLKQVACMETCGAEVTELKVKLASYRKKKVVLQDFDQLKAEKDLIKDSTSFAEKYF